MEEGYRVWGLSPSPSKFGAGRTSSRPPPSPSSPATSRRWRQSKFGGAPLIVCSSLFGIRI
ncbi:hypothetical protein HanXRQr2_Chr07g0289051 [Helianthus annuus]|uniref:Uncharacterized protein n=1 Tax=Helianthus annuus TaxID=4232 RepID=A0A9K3IK86_HELAN|nr:hypothetical protein HanXRQr2_Chr07g0289051 [Helianthus annuus]KAJ0904247.1 hypothetical protein HanPSC8_Chr07g0279861 [Helianthus annuus]